MGAPHSHADADSHSVAYPDTDGDADDDTHGHSVANAHANGYAERNADTVGVVGYRNGDNYACRGNGNGANQYRGGSADLDRSGHLHAVPDVDGCTWSSWQSASWRTPG